MSRKNRSKKKDEQQPAVEAVETVDVETREVESVDVAAVEVENVEVETVEVDAVVEVEAGVVEDAEAVDEGAGVAETLDVVAETVDAADVIDTDGDVESTPVEASEHEAQAEAPAERDPASYEHLKPIIEALIFASPEPLTPKTLFKLLESEPKEDVETALALLRQDYNRPGGLQLVDVAGGYQIVTRPELHEYVRLLFHERTSSKLSVQALETLAVIAYRQPVTAPEITEIRGVNTSGVLNTLVDRKLVKIVGRKDVVGRPFMYATTRDFLDKFGLNDISDLPKVEDLADVLGFDPPSLDGGPDATALAFDFGDPIDAPASELSESIESNESTELTESTESNESIELTEASETSFASETGETGEASGTSETSEPIEAVESVDVVDSIETLESPEPIDEIAPSDGASSEHSPTINVDEEPEASTAIDKPSDEDEYR